MSQINLVAFDLDGTVLETLKRTVSPRVKGALAQAHGGGVLTCVVSGRPVKMVPPAIISEPWLDWLITVNGAVVSDAHSREVLFRRPIAHDDALDVLDCVKEFKPAWNAFLPEEPFFEEGCLSYMAEGMERQGSDVASALDAIDARRIRHALSDVSYVTSFREVLLGCDEDVDKLGCNFPTPEASHEAARRLRARGDLEVARMGDAELEITRAGVTKGSALDLLCGRLGLDERHAVAFGDSGNDLSLTGRACTFVAMGNGTEQIRDAADEVCPSIDEDGVAQWLEAHL